MRVGGFLCAVGGALLCASQLAHGPALHAAPGAAETRALWVLRSSLTSPASIAALIESARASGFNTLLVQVRGRGDAYYHSRYEPRARELNAQPDGFDPLERLLGTAHGVGLQVHAWLNVNLIASATELPASPNHIVYDHPEWLMVPRALAREMAAVDTASPAYLGRLSRWTRAAEDVEGLYMSPASEEAVAHLTAVVSDLVSRYPLDGVHLDYLRYPDDRFDFSRYAIAAFRASLLQDLSEAERRRLDGLAQTDPLAYPDAMPEAWNSFRRAQLSTLLMRLRTAIKAERQDTVVSAAVAPDVDEAFNRRLQDWRTWLESGLVDAICPMAYTPEAPLFAQQIAAARELAGAHAVWAGIGAYRLSPAQTVQRIQIARQQGADGFVLFSYDSLTEGNRAADPYLSQIGRAMVQATRGSR